MKKVVVVGSLNMDLAIRVDKIPNKGETIHGHDFLINTGGKGGNQAVASVKSGAQTFLIGSTGRDAFGEEILKSCKSYGINTDYIQVQENISTGIAMIICHDSDNRIILNPGANYNLSIDFAMDKLTQIAKEGDIFVTQFENDFYTTLKLLEFAKSIGMKTIFNPAPAKVFPEEFYKYIDILVINQSECEVLTGIYPDSLDKCRKAGKLLRERQTENIVITLGSEGSVAITPAEDIKIKAYSVKAVDSTAAGDSFIGAMAARLSFNCTIKEALEYATKVAAITVTRSGAQISIPTADEVNKFF